MPIRLGTRKLAAKWAGPYRVLDQVAREAYRLELPANWRIHPVFHTSQLKEVLCTDATFREAPVILEDSDPEFEVERILAKRVVKGKN